MDAKDDSEAMEERYEDCAFGEAGPVGLSMVDWSWLRSSCVRGAATGDAGGRG